MQTSAVRSRKNALHLVIEYKVVVASRLSWSYAASRGGDGNGPRRGAARSRTRHAARAAIIDAPLASARELAAAAATAVGRGCVGRHCRARHGRYHRRCGRARHAHARSRRRASGREGGLRSAQRAARSRSRARPRARASPTRRPRWKRRELKANETAARAKQLIIVLSIECACMYPNVSTPNRSTREWEVGGARRARRQVARGASDGHITDAPRSHCARGALRAGALKGLLAHRRRGAGNMR